MDEQLPHKAAWMPVERLEAGPRTRDDLLTLLRAGRPCLWRDALPSCEAAARLLREELEHTPLPVRHYRGARSFAYTVEQHTLSELRAVLAAERHQEEGQEGDGRHYLAGPNLLLHEEERVRRCARAFAQLLPVSSDELQEVGAWAGRDGQRTQMHFDLSHNILHVVEGRKVVLLASPRDYVSLYTYTSADLAAEASGLRRMYRFSRCDVRAPNYVLFPRLERVALSVAVVSAGESLLIPAAHFHDVLSEGDAASGLCLALNVFWKPSSAELAQHKWLRVFIDDDDDDDEAEGGGS